MYDRFMFNRGEVTKINVKYGKLTRKRKCKHGEIVVEK